MNISVQGFVFKVFLFFTLCFHASAMIVDVEDYKSKLGGKKEFSNYTEDRLKKTIDIFSKNKEGFPLRIEILDEDTIKIRYANSDDFRPEYSWSVLPEKKWVGADYRIVNLDNVFFIKTSQLTVQIQKNPLLLSILNSEGVPVLENQGLFADSDTDESNIAEGQEAATRLILGARFKMLNDEHFYGLGQKLRRPLGNGENAQGDTSLDWRGRKRDIDKEGVTDEYLLPSHFGNTLEGREGGANGNLMVPFLLSTRGVSVFLDTVYKSYWEFDSDDSWYVKQDCDMDWEVTLPNGKKKAFPKCEKAEMRFYVTVSKNPQSIFTRYTELTGKPLMPPRWSLGFMQSKYGYKNWKETQKAADDLKNAGFPLDALFLDLQWFGGVPGVHYANFNADFAMDDVYNKCQYRRIGTLDWFQNDKFDFSDSVTNLKILKEKGVEVVPIQESYLDTCTDNYQEAQEKGFLARTDFSSHRAAIYANGEDKRDSTVGRIGYFGQVAMVDTSNKEAREWFWEKHVKVLKEGAATFWTDLGEPEHYRWWWKYYNEEWGNLWHADVHNVWDLNRAKMFYDGFQKDFPERRPFLLSRSGYAGSQRYGVGIWSGDAPGTTATAASQMPAHLNLSLSGIPYVTSDIGGFGGLVASPELYTRWLQMESFSSLTRAHGNATFGDRRVQPNEFPETYEVKNDQGIVIRTGTYSDINKKYLLLRESLVPYLYTFAFEAYSTGMPILRALPLIYPKDENVVNIGSEYLFGSSLLVAPVLSQTNGKIDLERDVYLPEGKWYDLHTGDEFEGNKTEKIKAPIDILPLFAKEGAIIPKALLLQSLTDSRYETTRVVEIYPSLKESEFTLYDDNGTDNAYKKGNFGQTKMKARLERSGGVTVKIEAMTGSYSTKPDKRAYFLEVRMATKPNTVEYKGTQFRVETCSSIPTLKEENKACYYPPLKKLYVSSLALSPAIEKTWIIR